MQLSPLVLAGSQTLLQASLAPGCFACPPARVALHDIIRVRKYTIRYTSYGPPRAKLQFQVQTADWLGQSYPGPPTSGDPKPLASEHLVAICQQLDDVRTLQDRTCLDSTSAVAGEPGIPATMAGSDNASQGASQPHTQYAFGTQLAQPARARSRVSEDMPKFLGVNRREPVLAGSTQREDLLPKPARPAFNDHVALLSLLNKRAPQSSSRNLAHSPKRSPRKTHHKPQMPKDPATTQMMTQLPVHANSRPTQTPSSRHAMDVQVVSPTSKESTRQQADETTTVRKSKQSLIQKFASECSWMQDFDFTRDAFRVNNDQLLILRKEASWHKPFPGHTFPTGNVPVQILTTLERLADENAALEAGPESDEEMDEDPSPEFPVESLDPTPDSPPQPTQTDDVPTSQVSWSRSPSPKPPKKPTRPEHQLPPDSSFEMANPTMVEDARPEPHLAPKQDLIIIDSSTETENEQNAPPSSPPIEARSLALDDDVEMEEYVPQGLGEDSVGGAKESQERPSLSMSPPSRPIIQVKETPYIKSKNGQHITRNGSHSQPRETSSGTSKHTSSTSIVYGTYNDKTSPNAQANVNLSNNKTSIAVEPEAVSSRPAKHLEEVVLVQKQPTAVDDIADVAMNKETSAKVAGGSPQQVDALPREHLRGISVVQDVMSPRYTGTQQASTQTRVETVKPPKTSTQIHTMKQPAINERLELSEASRGPSLTPGSVKRKHDNSPSKRSTRNSKRREIKIVDFGVDSSGPVDPTPTLQAYREEEFRKFQDARKSSTGFEIPAEIVDKVDSRSDDNVMQVETPIWPNGEASVSEMSPRHESLYNDPDGNVATSKTTPALQAVPATLPASQSQLDSVPEPSFFRLPAAKQPSHAAKVAAADLNLFKSFKTAYPEYDGDLKHFKGQCAQMIKLDQEDKMVPKWQWDDYVIRNKTHYKGYALDCLDRGEDPQEYHRFYKDAIRDTIYLKGIIQGRATLLQALEQLDPAPPTLEPAMSTRNSPNKVKRSRASLPDAFGRPESSAKGHLSVTSRDRPRQSLPSRTQRDQQTTTTKYLHPKRVPSHAQTIAATSKRSIPPPNLPSRLLLDGAASPRTSTNRDNASGTSDCYRDFYFAYQRTTSMTGSTEVSSTQGRGHESNS
ncbi:hypothetical protein BDU57DRAFT_520659 [Ampelomyces quisqualis]|uniref:Uncharacterized protein n=1 Tax=Ampelomyces quisqualis TaxID=50730 RepID=A0A6A5QDJ1_AMPQU|nr:hypothetical protein BDU57DRAFT_520659 [Ampelomyces quisqualis]